MIQGTQPFTNTNFLNTGVTMRKTEKQELNLLEKAARPVAAFQAASTAHSATQSSLDNLDPEVSKLLKRRGEIVTKLEKITTKLFSKDPLVNPINAQLPKPLRSFNPMECLRLSSTNSTRAIQLPARRKTHWDYVLEEMKWMATDFREERKWKVAMGKVLGQAVIRDGKEKQARKNKINSMLNTSTSSPFNSSTSPAGGSDLLSVQQKTSLSHARAVLCHFSNVADTVTNAGALSHDLVEVRRLMEGGDSNDDDYDSPANGNGNGNGNGNSNSNGDAFNDNNAASVTNNPTTKKKKTPSSADPKMSITKRNNHLKQVMSKFENVTDVLHKLNAGGAVVEAPSFNNSGTKTLCRFVAERYSSIVSQTSTRNGTISNNIMIVCSPTTLIKWKTCLEVALSGCKGACVKVVHQKGNGRLGLDVGENNLCLVEFGMLKFPAFDKVVKVRLFRWQGGGGLSRRVSS